MGFFRPSLFGPSQAFLVMRRLSMTQQALNALWNAEYNARASQNMFWELAERLMDEGLVRIEDVAEIWGVAPDTARKKLKQWRDRVRDHGHTADRPALYDGGAGAWVNKI